MVKGKPRKNDFIVIPSLKNPRVVVPFNNKEITKKINLYKPHGKMGRIYKSIITLGDSFLVKSGIPLISKIRPLRYTDLLENIMSVCKQIFKKNSIQFSIYVGTPGKHQKLVLEISDEFGEKLGYAKIGFNKETVKLIENEIKALNILEKDLGFSNTPKALYCFSGKGVSFSIQKPVDSFYSDNGQLNDIHINFLYNLYSKTYSVDCSEIFIDNIENNLSNLSECINGEILKVLNDATNYIKGNTDTLQYTAVHGDFAPWNIFHSTDKIYVIDWEYFDDKGLIYEDLLHYILQYEILVKKHIEAVSLIKLIFENRHINKYSYLVNNVNVKDYLILYLLKMIIYQIQVDGLNKTNLLENRLVQIRIKMLKELLK
jgi:hypothetical protein